MTEAVTAPLDVLSPTCPLCHTLDRSVTVDALRAGAAWTCTRCDQIWTAARLETAAAYGRYVASETGVDRRAS